jgi:hypothetical protein
MTSTWDQPAAADLWALVAAVANSPIVVAPASDEAFADWDRVRHSPEIDALVLAWIADHVRGAPHRRRAH